jgi:hypothetical protein
LFVNRQEAKKAERYEVDELKDRTMGNAQSCGNYINIKIKTNFVAFNPQTNYTD